MPLFPSIERAASKHGAHVRAFQKLYEFHGLRTGSPRDFLQLAPRLTGSEAFRLDFSDLVRSTRDREHGELAAGEMLTIAGVAIGGPGISGIEMELLDSLGVLQVLLAGVGGWRDHPQPGYPGPAWDTAEAEHERRERLGYGPAETWALAAGDARLGVPHAEGARRAESGEIPEEIRDASEVSPEMRETLDRLELASLELKLHLDEVDRMLPDAASGTDARSLTGEFAPGLESAQAADEEDWESQVPGAGTGEWTDNGLATEPYKSMAEPMPEAVIGWKASPEYQENARAARTMFAEGLEADRAGRGSQRTDWQRSPIEKLPDSSLQGGAVLQANSEPVLAAAAPTRVIAQEQVPLARAVPSEQPRSLDDSLPGSSEIEMPPEADERRSRTPWIALAVLILVGALGLAYMYLPVLRHSLAKTPGTASSGTATTTPGEEGRIRSSAYVDGSDGSGTGMGSVPSRNGGDSRSVSSQTARAGGQDVKTGLTASGVTRSPQDRSSQEKTAGSSSGQPGMQTGVAGLAGSDGVAGGGSTKTDVTGAAEARRAAAFERATVDDRGAVPASGGESADGKSPTPNGAAVGTGGRVLVAPGPVYPQEARDRGIEGKVVVRALVDAGGHVTGVQVLNGPAELRQSATDAVRRRKYEPYVVKGEAAPFQTLVTLNYKLTR